MQTAFCPLMQKPQHLAFYGVGWAIGSLLNYVYRYTVICSPLYCHSILSLLISGIIMISTNSRQKLLFVFLWPSVHMGVLFLTFAVQNDLSNKHLQGTSCFGVTQALVCSHGGRHHKTRVHRANTGMQSAFLTFLSADVKSNISNWPNVNQVTSFNRCFRFKGSLLIWTALEMQDRGTVGSLLVLLWSSDLLHNVK